MRQVRPVAVCGALGQLAQRRVARHRGRVALLQGGAQLAACCVVRTLRDAELIGCALRPCLRFVALSSQDGQLGAGLVALAIYLYLTHFAK